MAEKKDDKSYDTARKTADQRDEKEISKAELDGHVAHLNQLFEKLKKIQDEARARGEFAEFRPLLRCSKCGLTEDVLFSGKHVTYWMVEEEDSGMRFEEVEVDSGYFICPSCGFLIHLPPDQAEDL